MKYKQIKLFSLFCAINLDMETKYSILYFQKYKKENSYYYLKNIDLIKKVILNNYFTSTGPIF